MLYLFFLFNDPATTEIYTLSLHDALPIWSASEHFGHVERLRQETLDLAGAGHGQLVFGSQLVHAQNGDDVAQFLVARSEEHTSELQSHSDLVCRLLLEKKNNNKKSESYYL